MTHSEILTDPRVFSNPHCFAPERWLEQSPPNERYFVPFGKGTRMCQGMRYVAVVLLQPVPDCGKSCVLNNLLEKGLRMPSFISQSPRFFDDSISSSTTQSGSVTLTSLVIASSESLVLVVQG